MSELSFDPATFSGCVRLFPIPDLVMFPHVIQPLHVFEPRYRKLLSDALADDQLIALPVLVAGWEGDENRPELEPVACLTKIISHRRLADGRFNLLVVGLNRILMLDELPMRGPYRQASVQLMCEQRSAVCTAGTRERLLTAFKAKLHCQAKEAACLDDLLEREMSLGVLTDLMAHTLDIDRDLKLRLLAEPNVDCRSALLLDTLVESVAQSTVRLSNAGRFPPDFSVN